MGRQQKTILFLCTGNYYRSRFAEVLFNSVARATINAARSRSSLVTCTGRRVTVSSARTPSAKMGLPWKASSTGLALERGVNNVGPMEVSAVTAQSSGAPSCGFRIPCDYMTEMR
jgi:protein-tyrosine-phosphatase